MAAAVADFKSAEISLQKIKKNKNQSEIKLQPTVDVLKTMGSKKSTNQFLVGFALETENEDENAIKKLNTKNCDLLILNSLNDNGAGFGTDTNRITIFDEDNKSHRYELKSKQKVAEDILNLIEEKW